MDEGTGSNEPRRTMRKAKRILCDIMLVLILAALMVFAGPVQAGAAETANGGAGGQAPGDSVYMYVLPKTADYAIPTLAIAASAAVGGVLFLAYKHRRKR